MNPSAPRRFPAGPVALLLSCPSLAAADVIGESYATDLVGCIASVSFAVQTGPSSFIVFSEGAPIVLGSSPGSVVGQASGSFEWKSEVYDWGFQLDLSGPTETSPWSLKSTGPDNRVYIMSVILDSFPTATSGALFDDGSAPSTPGSGPGSPSAITVSGPAVINTGYDQGFLWAHPSNAGDMYTSVLVQWAELGTHEIFGIGLTAEWILDTDVIPAPSGALILALAGAGALRRRW
jgi:hypothetical protein